MKSLNSRLKTAYAIAKQIPYRKNKKAIILKWCAEAKKAINHG